MKGQKKWNNQHGSDDSQWLSQADAISPTKIDLSRIRLGTGGLNPVSNWKSAIVGGSSGAPSELIWPPDPAVLY